MSNLVTTISSATLRLDSSSFASSYLLPRTASVVLLLPCCSSGEANLLVICDFPSGTLFGFCKSSGTNLEPHHLPLVLFFFFFFHHGWQYATTSSLPQDVKVILVPHSASSPMTCLKKSVRFHTVLFMKSSWMMLLHLPPN